MEEHSLSKQELISFIERAEALLRARGHSFGQIDFVWKNERDLLEVIAFNAMPRMYPTWRTGKRYDLLVDNYQKHMHGFPFEAVLHRGTRHTVYIHEHFGTCLTLMYVFYAMGLADFFERNCYATQSYPGDIVERLKYGEQLALESTEAMGTEAVGTVLDAASTIMWQGRLGDASGSTNNPSDILGYMVSHNPQLIDWERRLIGVVYDEARYFSAEKQTAVLSRGYAFHLSVSCMQELFQQGVLSRKMHTEFVRHVATIASPRYNGFEPQTIPLNRIHVGYGLFDAIQTFYDGMQRPEKLTDAKRAYFEDMRLDFEERECMPDDAGKISGKAKCVEVANTYRDTLLFQDFLTHPVIRQLELTVVAIRDGDTDAVIGLENRFSRDDWEFIRDELLAWTGENEIPDVRVVGTHEEDKVLLLEHHPTDSRELKASDATRVVKHIANLWKHSVQLELKINGKKHRIEYDAKQKLLSTTDLEPPPTPDPHIWQGI